MEFSFSGRGPREMNFAATNLAEMWRKWRQSIQLEKLHQGHPVIERTKQRVRRTLFGHESMKI